MITVDRRTITQILGSLMNKPEYLNDVDKYPIEVSDFQTQLDKFIFSAIYNLYLDGAESIHTLDIDNYLQNNDLAKKVMAEENGIQFLQDCESYAEPLNFSYYYNRFKKINLLRDLQKSGKDTSLFYCEDPLNENYTQINEGFDRLSTNDIINRLKGDIAELENKYVYNSIVEETTAFDGIKDLIKELKIKPEIGVRLQGDIFNTVTRGGRKGKLYLRSAGSGVGKTRSMVGDACNIAYPIRYEPKYGRWVSTGSCEKVLYVMTEQDPAEIQTMILAYLTGYNEEIFLYGLYKDEHMERINKALEIMETYKGNMLFARIPDPCASVVKNLFRRYNLQYGIDIFFYDYIFSSPAMLNEYRDLKLREDVCLRLFTTAIKNLAIELNAFILTSTQISNDDDVKGGFRDFRNIQGSKSIVNLVDFAAIMSRPTPDELNLVAGFQKSFSFTPDCVIDVFKNRRGRWNMIRIWCKSDLGTCRKYDLFVTTADMKPIENFQAMDFIDTTSEEFVKIEEYYNNGVEEKIEIEKVQIIGEETETMFETITKAFGDKTDIERRLKEVDLEDLL